MGERGYYKYSVRAKIYRVIYLTAYWCYCYLMAGKIDGGGKYGEISKKLPVSDC